MTGQETPRPVSAIAGIAWPPVPNAAGAAMLAMLYQFEQTQWLSPESLWCRQQTQLAELLRHATREVPFHRQRLPAEMASGAAELSPEAFHRLPRMARSDLQQSFDALVSRTIPSGHGVASSGNTSGSTGEPARYATTDLSAFFWHAFAIRDHLWHRRDTQAKMLAVRAGTKRVEAHSNWFADDRNVAFVTGPLVTVPADYGTDGQLRELIMHDPDYLLAAASVVRDLAKEYLAARSKPLRLKEVRSFGEPVDARLRDLCRRAWNVPLTDVYSTRETGYIALQCPGYEHYHVQSEGTIVEVIDDSGQPVQPGETGHVVVTPLHNFAMPLIRYEVGDMAEVGHPCPCGRGLPVLKRIAGRVRNMLVLPSGKRIWPMLGTEKYRDVAPVSAAQVAQKSLSEVEMRLVVERPLTKNEERALGRILLDSLGYGFDVSFAYLEQLPRTADGKFEDFVSLVA